MKGYSQLTQEQKYQIYAFKKAGWTQKEIALELGVHPSTVFPSAHWARTQSQSGGRAVRVEGARETVILVGGVSG